MKMKEMGLHKSWSEALEVSHQRRICWHLDRIPSLQITEVLLRKLRQVERKFLPSLRGRKGKMRKTMTRNTHQVKK